MLICIIFVSLLDDVFVEDNDFSVISSLYNDKEVGDLFIFFLFFILCLLSKLTVLLLFPYLFGRCSRISLAFQLINFYFSTDFYDFPRVSHFVSMSLLSICL